MLLAMKNNITLFSALLCLLFFAGSCTKETLKPSSVEHPFYVETEMQGKPVQIYSGKGDYIAFPYVDQAEILGATLTLYSANFTNGTDSFRVGFMAVQP